MNELVGEHHAIVQEQQMNRGWSRTRSPDSRLHFLFLLFGTKGEEEVRLIVQRRMQLNCKIIHPIVQQLSLINVTNMNSHHLMWKCILFWKSNQNIGAWLHVSPPRHDVEKTGLSLWKTKAAKIKKKERKKFLLFSLVKQCVVLLLLFVFFIFWVLSSCHSLNFYSI